MKSLGYVLAVISLVLGSIYGGYVLGGINANNKQMLKEQAQVKVVVQKNQTVAVVAQKAEEAAVVYRDRIVVKYQPIEKEIVKYVERENSSPADVIWLDANWVRLHDNAADAGNSELSATAATTESDVASDQTKKVGVKSGTVLKIVAENYSAYANCKVQLEGLQKYTTDLTETFNTK